MLDQIKTLGLLYVRPLRAIGRILDHGTLGWSAVLAIVSAGLVYLPLAAQLRSLIEHAMANSAGSPEAAQGAAAVLGLAGSEIVRLPLTMLILMAAVFVPASVILGARLEGTGSTGVALERDYMPALVCHLMAWAVALLPVAAVQWLFPWRIAEPNIAAGMTWRASGVASLLGPGSLVLFGLAGLYFLLLSVCAMRAVSGTSFGRAAAASGGALVASGILAGVYMSAGNAAYYLASPWVLYYLYMRFGSNVRSLGGGLSSRQRMRELLETSTLNPRDADAHYQLGLIYQKRHDLEKARSCFERSLAIDPKEADPHYQLGCVLRKQGEFKAALEHLQEAAGIDDKHSSSEVWREIGAVALDLNMNEHARTVLKVYTDRRPFDAEGLYWYGVALSRTGELKEARVALESAMEAARTAPAHRRRHVAQWGSLAARLLKAIPGGS